MKTMIEEERKFLGVGKNVFFAGLVIFFMDVSSEMIYPLVPLFLANVLGAEKSLIGLIEGIAEATASLLKFTELSALRASCLAGEPLSRLA